MNNLRQQTIEELSKHVKSSLAKIIEQSIYNFSQQYSKLNNVSFLIDSIYQNKMSEILNEINKKSYLYNTIINEEIDINNIAFLKPEELNPSKYESILKKKEMEEYSNKSSGSSSFKCVKCKKSNCNITEKQMRAGDEPPTTIVTCLECHHVFKFN